MAMNSFTSRRKGCNSGSTGGSVAPMTLNQYRVSRDSLRQMKFLAMKSGLVCPAWPSSKFAPTEVLETQVSDYRPALVESHAELRDVAREFERAIAEVFVVNHGPSLCRIRTRVTGAFPIPFAFCLLP
jgi:hypothetical protein